MLLTLKIKKEVKNQGMGAVSRICKRQEDRVLFSFSRTSRKEHGPPADTSVLAQ